MKQVELRLPIMAYTPAGIEILHVATEKEARKEYSRLRSIARKRQLRLEESQYKNRPFVRNWHNAFPTLANIDPRDIGTQLAKLRVYLQSPLSTLSGQKEDQVKRTVETLQDHGYNITESELDDFSEFMEWAQSKLEGLMYGSDEVAELFESARSKGLNTKELYRDFTAWMENRGELEELHVEPNTSAAEIRKRLGIPEPEERPVYRVYKRRRKR